MEVSPKRWLVLRCAGCPASRYAEQVLEVSVLRGSVSAFALQPRIINRIACPRPVLNDLAWLISIVEPSKLQEHFSS